MVKSRILGNLPPSLHNILLRNRGKLLYQLQGMLFYMPTNFIPLKKLLEYMQTYTFSSVYIHSRLIILWNWKWRNYVWECFANVDLQYLIFSQKSKVLAFVVVWSNPGLSVLLSTFPLPCLRDFFASFLWFQEVQVNSIYAYYFLCSFISGVNLREMRNVINLLRSLRVILIGTWMDTDLT
jgi:hypothetical protein